MFSEASPKQTMRYNIAKKGDDGQPRQIERCMNRETPDLAMIERICTGLLRLVADGSKQTEAAILSGTKASAEIIRLRFFIMYLAHVEWSLQMAPVSNFFGKTAGAVAYAVKTVEDLRDDPVIDAQLDEWAKVAGAPRFVEHAV